MVDEKMNAEKLVKQWADDESFRDFAESHGAVLRNFARWMSRREPAQAAKYRACVEAERKYLKIISNNTKEAYLNHNHIDIQIALDELRAALAGLEG